MIVRVTIVKNYDDPPTLGEQFSLNTKILSGDESEELCRCIASILRLRMAHAFEIYNDLDHI
jgi:hypothetical protein